MSLLSWPWCKHHWTKREPLSPFNTTQADCLERPVLLSLHLSSWLWEMFFISVCSVFFMSSLTSRYYGPRPGLSQQHSLLVQKHSLSLNISISQLQQVRKPRIYKCNFHTYESCWLAEVTLQSLLICGKLQPLEHLRHADCFNISTQARRFGDYWAVLWLPVCKALGLEFPAALQRHMAAVQKRPLKALFLARRCIAWLPKLVAESMSIHVLHLIYWNHWDDWH